MLFAADYPFLDILWTMIIFFAWVAWISILFFVLADIFRRHDISGGKKTLWTILVIVLPFLGVFAYMLTQADQMGQRQARAAESRQEQFDGYVRDVAGSGGAATEIEKAKRLLDQGAITPAEFEAIKAKALA